MPVNVFAMSGHIVRDPELKRSAAGLAVLPFSLAQTSRVRNPATAEYEDQPMFFSCVMFGSRAEALARILRRGMLVSVSGSLRQSSWTAPDGTRRSTVDLIVTELQLPPKGTAAGTHEGEREGNPPLSEQATPPAADLYDRDIPF